MSFGQSVSWQADEFESTDRHTALWRSRLLPPGDLLSRVRWVLLIVSWLVSIPRLVVIWIGPADLSVRVLGCTALLSLCWWWLHGYRRQSFPTRAIPFEALALFLTVFSADAITAFGVFYVSLNYRGVYATRHQAILLWPVYIAAFVGGIALCQAPLSFSPFASGAVFRIPGLVFSVGVSCLIGSTLIRHDRSLRRERILREAGAALAAVDDCSSAARVSLGAALALVDGLPDAGARLLIGPDGAMEVVAAAGASSARGPSAPATPVTRVPLRIEDFTRGELVVETSAPLPSETARALETLGAGIAMTFERIELAHRLRFHALHDHLTGLPNRVHLIDRLTRALRDATAHDRQVAVLYIDLDGFKAVNDNLGHAAGDKLLTEIGRRLETCLRPGDVAARLGGDEFVVLLNGVPSVNESRRVAAAILDVARLPVVVAGREVAVTTSIGIAIGSGANVTAHTLLHNADLALYQAKTSGRSRSVVFEQPLREVLDFSARDTTEPHLVRQGLGVPVLTP